MRDIIFFHIPMELQVTLVGIAAAEQGVRGDVKVYDLPLNPDATEVRGENLPGYLPQVDRLRRMTAD